MPLLFMCSIQALLSAPNPDDPLAENVAKHWKDNEQEAVATGRDPPNLLQQDSCTCRASHCFARLVKLYMSLL